MLSWAYLTHLKWHMGKTSALWQIPTPEQFKLQTQINIKCTSCCILNRNRRASNVEFIQAIKVYLPSLMIRRELNSLKWREWYITVRIKGEKQSEEMHFPKFILLFGVSEILKDLDDSLFSFSLHIPLLYWLYWYSMSYYHYWTKLLKR